MHYTLYTTCYTIIINDAAASYLVWNYVNMPVGCGWTLGRAVVTRLNSILCWPRTCKYSYVHIYTWAHLHVKMQRRLRECPPTPQFEPNVRCTAHGRFFARVRYNNIIVKLIIYYNYYDQKITRWFNYALEFPHITLNNSYSLGNISEVRHN